VNPLPIHFSGMVKHTFLRKRDYMNDLQIVLLDKNDRKTSSHQVIEDLRPVILNFAKKKNALSKVWRSRRTPVMSTMVAEIYGPDRNSREKVAKEVYNVFAGEASVADLDYSWRPSRQRMFYGFNQVMAESTVQMQR